MAGARCGEEFVSSVSKMTAQKWSTITDAVAVKFDAASFEEMKEGTRVYLLKHCEGLANREV